MDRIHSRNSGLQQTELDAEILQETAEALGNTGAKVEEALRRVESAANRVEQQRKRYEMTADHTERHRLLQQLNREIARYNASRYQAVIQYQNLTIHREAVGFRNHRMMKDKYRIPARMETLKE